jgi:hypothetical protein
MTERERKLLKEFAAYVEKEQELKYWLKQRELSLQHDSENKNKWITK